MTKKKKREVRVQTSFRMSREAYDLMQTLSEKLGLGRGSILELALRKLARAYQVEVAK